MFSVELNFVIRIRRDIGHRSKAVCISSERQLHANVELPFFNVIMKSP